MVDKESRRVEAKLAAQDPLISPLSAKRPDVLDIKVAHKVNDRELYSLAASTGQHFLHDPRPANMVATTDQDPIYSTPLPIRNVMADAALAVSEEEQGYTSVVLAKAPRAKKVKLKAKSPVLNVKAPLFRYPNPNARATMNTEEDNQYSAVSNVPKNIGAQILKKAAKENPYSDLVSQYCTIGV